MFTPTLTHSWRTYERALLALLILGRVVLFWRMFGVGGGFDFMTHLEMIEAVSWSHWMFDLRSYFYAYHPPLGFLLPHTVSLLGLGTLPSVQLLNSLFSLLGFFALRATLKHCGLLDRPGPIAFLYLTASLPLQLYMAVNLNLEAIIVGLTCVTLFLSVRLWWPGTSTLDRSTCLAGIVVALAVGLLTKFSAVVMLGLPGLVAVLSVGQGWWRRVAAAGAVSLAAVALVSPYYYTRYYLPEGEVFVSNTEFYIPGELAAAREERDRDVVEFFVGMLRPSEVHASEDGLLQRDHDALRLSDVWRDFWLKTQGTGQLSPWAKWLGEKQFAYAIWAVVAGTLVFLGAAAAGGVWNRFGILIAGYSLAQFAALMSYLWDQPFATWEPTKGLYIAPVTLAVGYVLSRLVPETAGPQAWRRYATMGVAALIPVVVAVHHWLPMA